MVPAIVCTCGSRVEVSVMVVLGLTCSCGIVISVKARAVLPYSKSAHPRILLKVFWSTVFSEVLDTVPGREVRIMQRRDINNRKSPAAS
jgi:hypothetical protein